MTQLIREAAGEYLSINRKSLKDNHTDECRITRDNDRNSNRVDYR